jgi:hypothetical protein
VTVEIVPEQTAELLAGLYVRARVDHVTTCKCTARINTNFSSVPES